MEVEHLTQVLPITQTITSIVGFPLQFEHIRLQIDDTFISMKNLIWKFRYRIQKCDLRFSVFNMLFFSNIA